jgi:hypothetical protein
MMEMDSADTSSDLPPPNALPSSGLRFDFGRQPRELIKQLQQGEGPLADHINAALNRARTTLGAGSDDEIVPVIVLYRHVERDYKIHSSPVRL